MLQHHGSVGGTVQRQPAETWILRLFYGLNKKEKKEANWKGKRRVRDKGWWIILLWKLRDSSKER